MTVQGWIEVHDLKHNSSGNLGSPHHRMYGYSYGADGLQEPYNRGPSFQAPQLTDPTTGPYGYYNQSPAYNSQSLPRTSANVTPTKGSMYNKNRMPPQQHMISYQQPNHTPPMQPALPCVYPPQEQVFGAPLRFESPATNLLSPYSEEYYSHGVTQPTANLPLPEPCYCTKPSPVTVQPKSIEGKAMDLGKISCGQMASTEIPKVPNLVAGPTGHTAHSSNDGDFTLSPSQAKHSESLHGLLHSDISTKTGFSFGGATTNTGISSIFEKVEKPFHLPDKINVKKGEEEEQELFCNRTGNITILKHNTSGKVRIMRREQVLKICDNHYINADTLLKPNPGSDKSWVCNAIDYEDEKPKPEQLGISLKKEEEALFKRKCDGAQQNVPKSPAKHCLQENRDVGYKLNGTKSSFGDQFAIKDREWDCNVCYVRNKPKDIHCVACQTKNPQTVSNPEETTVTDSKPPPPLGGPGFGAFSPFNPQFLFGASGQALANTGTSAFGARFNKKQGQWDCDACYARNESSLNRCVACQTDASAASVVTKPSETAGPPSGTAAAPTTKPQSSAFGSSCGSQFGMKEGQWNCNACYVRNELASNRCVACQAPHSSTASGVTKPSETAGPPAETAAAPTTESQSSAFGSSFGSQFGMKEGQWDCDACYVRN
ncbi:unnamed protein product [Boreogadus saida]